MKKSHKKKTAPAAPGTDKDRRLVDIRSRLLATKEARGLSYEGIARQCNMSLFTVMRFARGIVKTPTPLSLESIERFLDSIEGKV